MRVGRYVRGRKRGFNVQELLPINRYARVKLPVACVNVLLRGLRSLNVANWNATFPLKQALRDPATPSTDR